MRGSYYVPAGNPYSGPWYKSALEFPAHGEHRDFFIWFTLCFSPIRLMFDRLVAIDEAHPAVMLFAEALPVMIYLFAVCFGIHYALRYTLMDEDRRKLALCLVLFIGIPLSFVPYSWLLGLLFPRRVWQAFVSWFSYPSVYVPGLFRSPFGPPWVRMLLAISFGYLTAISVIAPALLVTEHDDQ